MDHGVGVVMLFLYLPRFKGEFTEKMSPIDNLSQQIDFFSHSDAIQNILKVLNYTTGLRISLVVRIQDQTWTTCAVLDEAGSGLQPGNQLELQTTY